MSGEHGRMKIINVVGARPNFMKMAPIIEAMDRFPDRIDHLLVHTGQHYDRRMSKSFFEDLGMPRPDIDLGVGSGSHAEQTGAGHGGVRTGLPAREAGSGHRGRRRQLDHGLYDHCKKARHQGGACRGGASLARYGHAGGDQPALHGRPVRLPVHHGPDGGRESRQRRVWRPRRSISSAT